VFIALPALPTDARMSPMHRARAAAIVTERACRRVAGGVPLKLQVEALDAHWPGSGRCSTGIRLRSC